MSDIELMRRDSGEAIPHSYDFETYLATNDAYCDPTISFHPAGLRDKELFENIVTRPGLIEYDGVPVGLPVAEAEDIADAQRSFRMAQVVDSTVSKEDVYVALLPLKYIVEHPSVFEQSQSSNRKIIFVESENSFEDDSEAVAVTEGMQLHRLQHPLTKTSAQLVGYEAFNAMHIDVAPDARERTLNEVLKDKIIPDSYNAGDGRTIKLSQGGNFDAAVEFQLWDLFSQRFDDISANSYLKLEEDKESTVNFIFRNPQYTFIYRTAEDGVIDACAFLADNRQAYPWISEQFFNRRDQEVNKKYHEQPYEVFVPGIAAYKAAGMSASAPILDVLSKIIAATNHSYTAVRFECTDVSSKYIPALVERAIKANPSYVPVKMEEVGRKSYYALEVNMVSKAEQ